MAASQGGLPRKNRGGRFSTRERAALFGGNSRDRADVKNAGIFDHVVVEDSHATEHEELQHLHDHEAARLKNEPGGDGLAQELAETLAACGMQPGAAREKALALLAEYGAEVCARQRRAFERRCELARASRGGLRSPLGLLYASIREDWPLPAEKEERRTGNWYTDKEFEEFFEH